MNTVVFLLFVTESDSKDGWKKRFSEPEFFETILKFHGDSVTEQMSAKLFHLLHTEHGIWKVVHLTYRCTTFQIPCSVWRRWNLSKDCGHLKAMLRVQLNSDPNCNGSPISMLNCMPWNVSRLWSPDCYKNKSNKCERLVYKVMSHLNPFHPQAAKKLPWGKGKACYEVFGFYLQAVWNKRKANPLGWFIFFPSWGHVNPCQSPWMSSHVLSSLGAKECLLNPLVFLGIIWARQLWATECRCVDCICKVVHVKEPIEGPGVWRTLSHNIK